MSLFEQHQMKPSEGRSKKSDMSRTHSNELLEQGFSVFEKAWTDAEVDQIRALLESRYEEHPPRTPWGLSDEMLADTVRLSYTGLTFLGLLQERPEIASLVLKPQILDAMRDVLGPDMQLELVGGLVTDETRPFFSWHMHIGNYDGGLIQSSGNWPVIDNARRITTLLYLNDIDEDGGLLLAYPRRIGDPTAPPFDPSLEHWEGQAEIRIPRGSLVAMEQCTWHTALPMKRPGRRMFLGCSFRAGWEPKPSWHDHNLTAVAARHPLFASVVAPPPEEALSLMRPSPTSKEAKGDEVSDVEAQRHAQEMREQGYTILSGLWADDELDQLHAVISGRVRRANPAQLWSLEGEYVAVNDASAGVHHVGLGFFRLLEEHPGLAPLVLKPRMLDALQASLGEGMELEMAAGIVSDEGRPFLRWHTHIGGHESGFDPEQVGWPHIPSVERVTALLYLDDVNDDSGALLLYPRRTGDPTAPLGDYESEWPGQLEVRVPRGTLVILDQCTWHAARAKRVPGLRIFVATYFCAAGVSAPTGTRALEKTPVAVESTEPSTPAASPASAAASLESVEELSRRASNAMPKWRVVDARRNQNGTGLLLDVVADGVPLEVSALHAREGERAFIVVGGVAYSYRGSLERQQADPLRAVLKRLHPVVKKLLGS